MKHLLEMISSEKLLREDEKEDYLEFQDDYRREGYDTVKKINKIVGSYLAKQYDELSKIIIDANLAWDRKDTLDSIRDNYVIHLSLRKGSSGLGEWKITHYKIDSRYLYRDLLSSILRIFDVGKSKEYMKMKSKNGLIGKFTSWSSQDITTAPTIFRRLGIQLPDHLTSVTKFQQELIGVVQTIPDVKIIKTVSSGYDGYSIYLNGPGVGLGEGKIDVQELKKYIKARKLDVFRAKHKLSIPGLMITVLTGIEEITSDEIEYLKSWLKSMDEKK